MESAVSEIGHIYTKALNNLHDEVGRLEIYHLVVNI